jgi:hypothetical protein
VQRLRELASHGGIAILAVVFAVALATYGTANALAEQVVSAITQHAGPEYFDPLDFHVLGTDFVLDRLVQAVLALLLSAAALLAVWRLTRGAVRTCPECCSDVASEATVCRYCTTDLRPDS